MIGQIIIGLLGMALGLVLVIKAFKVVSIFGTSGWAEARLGGGGTYMFVRIVGIIFILFFFFFTFGWADDLFKTVWNSFWGIF